MPNLHRGDTGVVIGGRRFTLRLTLGALVELEAAFAVESLHGLGRRFAAGQLRSRDLLQFPGGGLRVRGGCSAVAPEERFLLWSKLGAAPAPGGRPMPLAA